MNEPLIKYPFAMHLRRVLNTLAILFMASSANASIAQLTDVPVPVNTDIQIVADNMIHNGNRVTLASYSSSLSLEESASFYRQVWSSDEPNSTIPGLVETQVGEWLLISRLQDGYNTVIQLRLSEPYQSTGYVSIMPVPGPSRKQSSIPSAKGAQAPDGLELLSSTITRDGKRLSQLSVYSSSYSIESASRDFIRHLLNQNWTLVSERNHAQSKVVLMNRKAMRVEMVVSDGSNNGGSVIVVNETQDRG